MAIYFNIWSPYFTELFWLVPTITDSSIKDMIFTTFQCFQKFYSATSLKQLSVHYLQIGKNIVSKSEYWIQTNMNVSVANHKALHAVGRNKTGSCGRWGRCTSILSGSSASQEHHDSNNILNVHQNTGKHLIILVWMASCPDLTFRTLVWRRRPTSDIGPSLLF